MPANMRSLPAPKGPFRYRKKPVEVTAVEWDPADPMSVGTMVAWLQSNGVDFRHDDGLGAETTLTIPTLEGDMRADPGDFVIKGVKGEFYPCKPDIFIATYDLA